MIQRCYVSTIRLIRMVAGKTGLLLFLEKRHDKLLFLYFRSLFSIYDVDDMVRLDLPWWTFAAIRQTEEFLQRLNGKATVFEYGPGASTVWLSKRAHRVAYVEHDEAFSVVVKRLTMNAPNVEGVLVRPDRCQKSEITYPSGRQGYKDSDFLNYVLAIRNFGGPFDLIVIDGRARSSCLKEAIKHLKPHGVILFDNSHRKRYKFALKEIGLQARVFWGLAPALPYFEETTILGSVKN